MTVAGVLQTVMRMSVHCFKLNDIRIAKPLLFVADTSVTSPASRSLRVDDDLELPSGITRQQLTTLKNEAAHCLNDSLFSKLSGIEEVSCRSATLRTTVKTTKYYLILVLSFRSSATPDRGIVTASWKL